MHCSFLLILGWTLLACAPAPSETKASTPPRGSITAPDAATDRPTLNTPIQISPEGVGAVHIGMTPEEASLALGVEVRPELYSDDPAACDIATPQEGYPGLSFLTINGRISVVHLFTSSDQDEAVSTIATSQGIALLDTGEEIRSAYGQSVVQEIQPYSGGDAVDLYVWSSETRGVRFQLSPTGKVWAIHAGTEAIRLWEGCL